MLKSSEKNVVTEQSHFPWRPSLCVARERATVLTPLPKEQDNNGYKETRGCAFSPITLIWIKCFEPLFVNLPGFSSVTQLSLASKTFIVPIVILFFWACIIKLSLVSKTCTNSVHEQRQLTLVLIELQAVYSSLLGHDSQTSYYR